MLGASRKLRRSPFLPFSVIHGAGRQVVWPAHSPAIAASFLRVSPQRRPLPTGNGRRTSLSSRVAPRVLRFAAASSRYLPSMPKAPSCGSVTAMSLASSVSLPLPSSGLFSPWLPQRPLPNPALNRTACKLRLQVPSALRAPAAG